MYTWMDGQTDGWMDTCLQYTWKPMRPSLATLVKLHEAILAPCFRFCEHFAGTKIVPELYKLIK
jgi:hypothetical protein